MARLSSRLDQSFSAPARRRGLSLFRRGRVRVGQAQGLSISASVEGTWNYDLRIDWTEVSQGWLEVECSCPFFETHREPCKHLWALVLALEDRGLAGLVPGEQQLRARALDEFSEDEESATSILEDELEAFDIRSGHSQSFGPGFARHLQPPPPKWQKWVEQLERSVPRTPNRGPGRAPLREPRRQAFFLIDPAQDFVHQRYVRVSFYRRDALRSGGFGKLKASPTGDAELEHFDEVDRKVLLLLTGLGRGDWEGFAGSGLETNPRWRSVAVTPSVFETVLPILCETGRFGWLVEDPERGCVPVSYDPSPPWRLELVGESEGERLMMRGVLAREPRGSDGVLEAQRREIGEAKIMFATGELFFGDSIGRLAHARSHYPWAVTLRADPDLYIPLDQVPAALASMTRIAGQPSLRLPEDIDAGVEVEPEPILQVSFEGGDVRGRPVFLYGERRVAADDPIGSWSERVSTENNPAEGELPAPRLVRRSYAEEWQRLSQLEPYAGGPDAFRQRGDAFLAAAHHLREHGWRLETDGKALQTSVGFSASVSSGQTSGIDWFELKGVMIFGGEQVALPELLRAAERGERFITLDDGSLGLLPEQWLERFAPLSQLLDGKEELRFDGHQALLLDALLASQPEVDIDGAFARVRARLREFEGLEPRPAPPGFVGTLRPYQELGVAWMEWLADLGLGGCLADDMGLGKTIQVLALLEAHRSQYRRSEPPSLRQDARRPSILVVPRSLLHNWQSEAERFTPRLTLHAHHGLDRAKRLHSALADGDSARGDAPPVIITTYGTLLRDIGKLKDIDFEFAVLDEAQAIKNASSQTAKACRLLRARHRLALTGTPVENHLGELWSLLEFLNPGMLGSLPGTASLAGRVQLPAESLELLARAIRPLVLRRAKSEVLRDLPAKTEQTLFCELSKKEQSRYDELLAHYRASLGRRMRSVGLGRTKIMVLEALLRLRQAACHPGLIDHELEQESSSKVDLLLERLREITEEGHKALVFSQFTRLLAIVRGRLDAQGLVYEYLDGKTHKRQERVDRFQEDPDCPLFLISLKAGGVGLNLTAASYVFLLDPWWNPAVESQAIDRAHRIGQEQPVFAYRLIARGTIEEKILDLQSDKKAIADAIITQDQRFFAKLTAEDLALLLGGSLT